MTDNPFRDLPAVDTLVDRVENGLPRALMVSIARDVLDEARRQLAAGRDFDPFATAQEVARAVERSAGTPVINASGVLLHTNLGRARWSEAATRAASQVATRMTNLEMDLRDGSRSKRGGYVKRLLEELTGAANAIVVNNNAAALVLALAATASGKATVISRGELIEIGGSYRLPEVMAAAGTRMVEVGTTNRTRLGDYQTALQLHEVGSILKVHPSNYRVEGFTSEASIETLASIATGQVVIHDIGSGLLDGSARWVPTWLKDEPSAAASLRSGAHIVMFSGDKLLGGPQAGVIVGDFDLIEQLKGHPLARALRVDGVTYAALTATLESYLDEKPETIPFWRQALTDISEIKQRAQKIAADVGGTVEAGNSRVGGGSAPGAEIPSFLIRLAGHDALFPELLDLEQPILGRREDGDLLLDPRTIDPVEDQPLVDGISKCLS